MSSLEPRRSTLARVDDALGVAVVVLAALAVLSVIGWLVHTLFFFVKLAVLAVMVALAVRIFARRR